jgi:phosphoribosylanthranilate isomerase
MGRTLIKICGVTRVEDALAAARLGADFVGMVLHADSPRRIDVERARDIVASLPKHVTPVGVFVNAPAGQLTRTCGALELAHVQLHGDETPEYVDSLAALRVWKVLRADKQLPDRIAEWKDRPIEAILFDSAHGGSGETNDWAAVLEARDALAGTRFIAAGGLTPDDVGDVVGSLRPWAVDVSSGVEGDVKGVKSEEKVEAFIRAVRAADIVPSPGTPGEG